nr:MAG TPA: hypothetical protein [Caudoviricetes sp.]
MLAIFLNEYFCPKFRTNQICYRNFAILLQKLFGLFHEF